MQPAQPHVWAALAWRRLLVFQGRRDTAHQDRCQPSCTIWNQGVCAHRAQQRASVPCWVLCGGSERALSFMHLAGMYVAILRLQLRQ